MNKSIKEIENLLPGYNCGSCGYNTCKDYASHILRNDGVNGRCPILDLERYKNQKLTIEKMIKGLVNTESQKTIQGVLDNYDADIVLSPLKGEKSCREVLLSFVGMEVLVGDLVCYRPLGCPIVHFAKVIEKEGSLITVFIVGPGARDENKNIKDLGKCMIIAFEGIYEGRNVFVGQTVRFLPNHCMMQKIHSGVIVELKGSAIRIEGIDLKVWAPPVSVISNQ